MTDKVSEIALAIKQICEEKNIAYESVITTIEAALAVAYRKDFGEKNQNIKVDFDADTGGARVFDEKIVVEDALKEQWEKEKAEKEALAEEEEKKAAEAGEDKKDSPATLKTSTDKESAKKEREKEAKDSKKTDKDATEEEAEHFDPKSMISLADAKKIKKSYKTGDAIRSELFPPSAYGRMAAQTAKQVIIQKLREAERENLYNDFKGKEGSVINAIIQRVEGRMVLIDLGQTTALMPPNEQIPKENYNPGQRIKVFLVSVSMTPKGPEIIVSRAHPEMVRQLFAMEVPEIAAGSVEIKGVAREAGSRTKVAVASTQKNIDPVGSCVGQRGTRVQTIISELDGEKIDIIEYNEDSSRFITNALSPAKVLTIKLREKENEKIATAEVKEDQLSLAIGKAGQNVRLAARLTGWKIDIVSESKKVEDSKTDDKAKGSEEIDKKPPSLEATLSKGDKPVEEKPPTPEASVDVKEAAEPTKKETDKPEANQPAPAAPTDQKEEESPAPQVTVDKEESVVKAEETKD
ncbi:MAG: transcription termination factor NusA [Patescibacteria group bacterium]